MFQHNRYFTQSHGLTNPGSKMSVLAAALPQNLFTLFGVTGIQATLDIVCGGWPIAGDLHHHCLIASFGKMILGWRFCVEASGRKSFQLRLVEFVSVPDVPGSGDYRRNTIVAVRVRRDSSMRRYAKHDRIHANLIRIAFQNNGSDV